MVSKDSLLTYAFGGAIQYAVEMLNPTIQKLNVMCSIPMPDELEDAMKMQMIRLKELVETATVKYNDSVQFVKDTASIDRNDEFRERVIELVDEIDDIVTEANAAAKIIAENAVKKLAGDDSDISALMDLLKKKMFGRDE